MTASRDATYERGTEAKVLRDIAYRLRKGPLTPDSMIPATLEDMAATLALSAARESTFDRDEVVKELTRLLDSWGNNQIYLDARSTVYKARSLLQYPPSAPSSSIARGMSRDDVRRLWREIATKHAFAYGPEYINEGTLDALLAFAAAVVSPSSATKEIK